MYRRASLWIGLTDGRKCKVGTLMSPRVTPQPVNAGRRLRWMSSATAIDRRDPCSLDHLPERSEEHTSELQSLMRISYAVFCLKKKKPSVHTTKIINNLQYE